MILVFFGKEDQKMQWRTIGFSCGVAAGAIGAVFFLWKQPVALAGMILLLAVLKRRLVPIRAELAIFSVSGILGVIGESVAIESGAWSYPQPQLGNIPLWLPFLWGLAGTTGVSLYFGLTRK